MFTITKLNSISSNVNDILTNDTYRMSTTEENPDGILLRSFKMHDYDIKDKLLAVARAGAGVNNIPISAMTDKGIVVFNTPGANANAVRELVIASMIIASRNIDKAINWTQTLDGNEDVAKAVEAGKSNYVGGELAGKKLGVIGLGAIGALVANAGVALGMTVYGYDPYISIDGAWNLSNSVIHEKDINHLLKTCDFITMHVPLVDSTREMINAKSLSIMKKGVVIINCARGELVSNKDIKEAIANKKVYKYVTDFPTQEVLGVDGIIAVPHLGASTPEAENNCATMAAKQLKDYIENGNIVNSVNFPTVSVPRAGVQRVTVVHKNVANMIATATSILSSEGINIGNMTSASKGDLGYMILDVDAPVSQNTLDKFKATEGFIKVRVI